MWNTWLGRRGTCSGTHSVESRPDTDSDDRPWNRVGEAGSRWRPNRRRRTGDVSGSDTVDTTNGRRHDVGTAAARTAGRGRDEAQSLAATIYRIRPSDQLTPSQCPQLDGDARERQHVSSPVRQLRLTLGLTVRQLRWRLLGYFHSPTQLSFWSSILITLCLGYTTVSQFINSRTFLRRCSQLSILWLSPSALNSILFNSTSHALVHKHLPARSHEILAPARLGRGTRPRRQRHKLWTGSQRRWKRPIEGQSLHTKTVDRKSERDRLLHIDYMGDGFTGQKTQPTVSKYWRYSRDVFRPTYNIP